MKKTFVMILMITFGWPMMFRILHDFGCSTAVASALASAVFILMHAAGTELALWKEQKSRSSLNNRELSSRFFHYIWHKETCEFIRG